MCHFIGWLFFSSGTPGGFLSNAYPGSFDVQVEKINYQILECLAPIRQNVVVLTEFPVVKPIKPDLKILNTFGLNSLVINIVILEKK